MDSFSRLFYDDNADEHFDNLAGEVLMDETTSDHGIRITPVLTVWRKLRVEHDSMGAPPAGTVFPDDGIANDVDPGDIPNPNLDLMVDAFDDAFVDVYQLLGPGNDIAPFVYHVTDSSAATRDVNQESSAYWVAYIMGAYEPSTALDGDGDEDGDGTLDRFQWGVNYDNEPEHAFVFNEVLRDTHNDGAFPNWAGVYTQAHHEQQVVVHEIGHQFELYVAPTPHPPAGYSIMSNPQHDPAVVLPPDTFAEDELAIIRQTQSP